MKTIIAVILVLLPLFHFQYADQPVDTSQTPQVMMFTIHNNWAWGIQQSVTVIDRDGNCYSRYTDNSNYGYNYGNMPDGWIDLKEDGWYEKLLEISDTGEVENKLSENTASYIRRNVANFESWGSLPMKKYPNGTCDYGTRVLYGIYPDEDGEPCYAELACVGDSFECADSPEARDFVNITGLMRFDGFVFN